MGNTQAKADAKEIFHLCFGFVEPPIAMDYLYDLVCRTGSNLGEAEEELLKLYQVKGVQV